MVDRPDAPHHDLGDNWETIGKFYTDTLVPEALRRNRRLIQQMTSIDGLDLTIPGKLEKQLDRHFFVTPSLDDSYTLLAVNIEQLLQQVTAESLGKAAQ